MERIRKSKYLVIDTETYSNFNKREYLEAGYLKLSKVTKSKIETLNNRADKLQKEGALNTLTNKVRLLQIKLDDGKIIIIDTIKEKDFFLEVLKEMPKHIIIGHNLKFDIKSLYKYDKNVLSCKLLDTYILQKLFLYQTFINKKGADLGSTLEMHLDIKLPKDQGGSDWSNPNLTEEQLEYAKNDVKYLKELALTIFDKIHSKPIISLEMQLLNVMIEIELTGIKLNKDELLKRANELEVNYLKAENKLVEAGLNPRSSKQMIKHCSKYGLVIKSSAEKVLREKALEIPLIEEALISKKLGKEVKAIRKYVEDMQNNRLYASFNQVGTITGRMTSYAPNVQQIPRSIKNMFYDIKNKTILKIDYSAFQLRIASVIMKDKVMQEAFRNNEDLHKKTASLIYHVSMEEVTKQQRQTAKAINFGLIFGMSPRTLQEYVKGYGVEITMGEAERFSTLYFRAYKGVKRYHNENGVKLRYEEIINVETMFSRSIKLDKWTNANNYPTQGTEADIIKQAIIYWNKNKTTKTAKIINIIHDELIFEVDDNEVEILSKEISYAMNEPTVRIGINYPEPTEITILREE